MKSPNGLSIILPACNEAAHLESLVDEIYRYFSVQHFPFEIVIVNDGSRDKTGSIADRLAGTYRNIFVLHHNKTLGYGKSLRAGFARCGYENIFFTDADRQFRIKDFDVFLPYLFSGRREIVVGYRIDRKDPTIRRGLGRIYNRIVNALFNLDVKDVNCAFKLSTKSLYEKLGIFSNGSLINAEILAKCRLYNITIRQKGIRHYPRSAGKSTVHVLLAIRSVIGLFHLYGEIKGLKNKMRVSR